MLLILIMRFYSQIRKQKEAGLYIEHLPYFFYFPHLLKKKKIQKFVLTENTSVTRK